MGKLAGPGHNNTRDELHGMAVPREAAFETEPTGLIPLRPFSRPAAVLTDASPHGRLAEVDVGIVCPAACIATDMSSGTLHVRFDLMGCVWQCRGCDERGEDNDDGARK